MTTAAPVAVAEDYSAPKHNSDFRRRRFLNWFPLGITYATFYMGRYNLNVASTTIMSHFAMTKEQFGIIGTAGFWTYALSVIFNGPLADRYGGRKAILLAAVGAAALNGIIGLLFMSGWTSKVLVGMSLLYAVNMYFQSFGALSIVKINSHWFHVRERGVFGGVFGIMISCGYFLAMTVGGWILASMSWYWVFLVPSMAIAAMFVVEWFLAADTPKDAGHENIDTGDATSRLGAEKDTPVDFAYLVKNLYSNPVVVTITAAEFCTGFVRQGLMYWFVSFLKEVHGVTPHATPKLFSLATGGITVGGILGGLLCGWMSDALFQSRRAPVAFLFYLGQIGSLIWLGRTHSALTASFLIGFSCMWIFGVHGMLSGTASMDFGGTKAAGTAAGLMDGVQYLASGLTGVLLGYFLDKYGWGIWTYSIIPFSAIGAILMLTLWNATPQNTKITLAS
ncbi:MAG: MFS transporter [Elusimicrobia bacterium]|nr:MFS transporter [Elusimicrobiota bacterium]